MSDFDREIERELDRFLGPVDHAAIPARRAPVAGGFMRTILGGAGAAIGAKVLTGFAVAAFAAAGAGAATEVAITGSLNPTDWGQQVKQQVATCKAALEPGQHGIGRCVSAFAKEQGTAVSDENKANAARESPGKSDGNAKGKSKSKGKNNKETGQPPIHLAPPWHRD